MFCRSGIERYLRVKRGKRNEDKEVRRWTIQRRNISHARPKIAHHRPQLDFTKWEKRGSSDSISHAIADAAFTQPSSPRHHAYKDKESHTRKPKDLKKSLCSPLSIEKLSLSQLSPIALMEAGLIILSLLLRLLLLLLRFDLRPSGGSRRGFLTSRDLC